MQFVIATHAWLEGARLSKRGDFANMPFDSVAAAELRASELANGRTFSIERRHTERPGGKVQIR